LQLPDSAPPGGIATRSIVTFFRPQREKLAEGWLLRISPIVT
jgi:hypothetical protein